MVDTPNPLTQAYRAYEKVEGQMSTALDQLVATNGFADLFATSATTVMALTRLANGTVDRFVRATRLAARQDVTGLARQLARTEDKLERLLQAVEALEDRLAAAEAADAAPAVGGRPTRALATPAPEPAPERAPEPAAQQPAVEPVPAPTASAGATRNGKAPRTTARKAATAARAAASTGDA